MRRTPKRGPVPGKEKRVLRHAIHVRRLSMRLYRSKSLLRQNKDKEKREREWPRDGGENEWKGHVHPSAKSNWRGTFLPYRACEKPRKDGATQRANIAEQTVWFVLNPVNFSRWKEVGTRSTLRIGGSRCNLRNRMAEINLGDLAIEIVCDLSIRRNARLSNSILWDTSIYETCFKS